MTRLLEEQIREEGSERVELLPNRRMVRVQDLGSDSSDKSNHCQPSVPTSEKDKFKKL